MKKASASELRASKKSADILNKYLGVESNSHSPQRIFVLLREYNTFDKFAQPSTLSKELKNGMYRFGNSGDGIEFTIDYILNHPNFFLEIDPQHS